MKRWFLVGGVIGGLATYAVLTAVPSSFWLVMCGLVMLFSFAGVVMLTGDK